MKPRYLYPKDYYADPSANVFNGKLYVYPSHDWEAGAAFDDDGGHFQMKDYHVDSGCCRRKVGRKADVG